ncbi:MAG: 2-C-methyl-D-erythritol 4-phosphate cytidylyltransferase [Ignavibacteria bacterium]|nr:2-C-methyl-D-erythritol 4-phosphate cytidylyltransferase [Ignavibacteria bacterium]
MKVKVIIPASGSGERFGGKTPKQFLKIDGKEIIAHTLEKFNSISLIDEIIISTQLEYFVKLSTIIKKYNLKKVKKITEGGKLRQDSVYNALINLECDRDDLILVHDAVRPFISNKKIIELVKAAGKEKCVILGLPVNETIKRVDKNNIVTETLDRNNVWAIQTPQAFQYSILLNAFEKAMSENFIGTDEAAIVENAGIDVKVMEGEKRNIKITVKGDVRL